MASETCECVASKMNRIHSALCLMINDVEVSLCWCDGIPPVVAQQCAENSPQHTRAAATRPPNTVRHQYIQLFPYIIRHNWIEFQQFEVNWIVRPHKPLIFIHKVLGQRREKCLERTYDYIPKFNLWSSEDIQTHPLISMPEHLLYLGMQAYSRDR